MNALGDCAQTTRAMIDSVHRGDDSEKNLCRANVACRFVAADVLLTRLQRESIGRTTFGIVRDTHQPARHMTFVLIARGEVCRVWAAEPQRNAETLGVTNSDICAKFSRRLQ